MVKSTMTKFEERVQELSQGIIDSLEGEEDHFHLIGGIIGNLAAYLADTPE